MRSLFLLCFLVPTLLFAQTPAKITGYYINLNGDTTIGSFPGYADAINNPNDIKFVSLSTNDQIVLTATNCKMVHVDNYDTYIAYSGGRLINPITYTSDFDQVDSSDQVQQVATFLRVLFDDKNFKVFILKDKIRTNFFYQDKDAPITELVYKLYITKTYDLGTINTYQQQLKQLFVDSSTNDARLEDEVDNLEYKENDLVLFFQKKLGVQHKKEKIKYPNSFFVTGGVAINAFKVNGDPDFAEAITKYNTTVAPALIIGYNFPVQRDFGRLIFSVQFKIYSYKNSGQAVQNDFGDTIKTTTTYKSDLLLLPGVFATYAIVNKKNIQWNVGPGIVYGILTGAKESGYVDGSFRPPYTTVQNGKNTFITANLETSLVINKKIMFLINHSFKGVVDAGAGFSGYHSSTQLTAGWLFR
jgi:hypothetical protein